MATPGPGEGSLGVVLCAMVGSAGFGVSWIWGQLALGSARCGVSSAMSHGGSCAAPATWLSQGSVGKFAEGKLM